MNRISLSIPNLNLDIVDNLKECIESGWISSEGKFVKQFEANFAQYVGVNKAVSVQSGTAAIHLALRALGVEQGHEVIVPTLTFIAAVNPVKYQGAEPIFMDCDDTLNMDCDKLQMFLENECRFDGCDLINNRTERVIKAIIVVHVFGNLANIERIMALASKYNLKVLEDATEALGTFRVSGNSKIHAGTFADIGVFSFNANKIITTGGGGMIIAKDQNLLEKMRFWSTQAKTDSLFFVHDEIGFNYRMNNLQASLGVSQLNELETFIDTKIKHYHEYRNGIDIIPGLKMLSFDKDTRSNHWFYSVLVDSNEFGISRNDLIYALEAVNIETRPIWKLIHTNKPYQENQTYLIEKAYEYEAKVINIPCSTNLQLNELNYVLEQLKKIGNSKDLLNNADNR